MRKIILGLAILIFSPTGFGKCVAKKWPYSKEVKSIKPYSLHRIPRSYLMSYLRYEMTQGEKNRVPGLADKILFYLENTETNEGKRNLFGAFKFYNQETEGKEPLKIDEICSLEQKAKHIRTSN